METATAVEFRFRFVREGETVGLFRWPSGLVADDHLRLADTRIPYSRIGDTGIRGNRVTVEILGDSLQGKAPKYLADSVLVVEPKDIRPSRLETLIDERRFSQGFAAEQRAAGGMGMGDPIRSEKCPSCGSTVEPTHDKPSIYCPYCISILSF